MDEEPGGEKEGEEGRENLRLQAWQPRLWHRSLAPRLSSLLVKGHQRPSLAVQWVKCCASHAEGLGSIPGYRTRSHLLQLRAPHAAVETKDATTKTQGSQIKILF